MAVDGNVVWRHFSFKSIVDDVLSPLYSRLFDDHCNTRINAAYFVTCRVLHNSYFTSSAGTRFALHLVQRGTSYWPLFCDNVLCYCAI